MKTLQLLVLTLSITGFVACGPDAEDRAIRDSARSELRDIPEGSVPPPAAPVATSNVQHYICPNNCEGSGGPAAGTCPVCGSEYEHNQAFHSQSQPAATTPGITTSPTTPGTAAEGMTPTMNTSSAQNADGEWHYACPDGHPGAASAGVCATCGKTLEHNQAYHSTTPTTDPMISRTTTLNDATAGSVPGVTTTPSSAQNASGEWHYACPDGHPGGASAGVCATCGKTLEHNQAYHAN